MGVTGSTNKNTWSNRLNRHNSNCNYYRNRYNNCNNNNRNLQNSINYTISRKRAEEKELNYKKQRITVINKEIVNTKIKIRKLRDSYEALKSICMSADATTKKNKSEQMKMISGRYLDRINLLESQKNVLNKQELIHTSKINTDIKNIKEIDILDTKIATKSRMGLYSMDISNRNTKIIWLLKCTSYIMSIILIFVIMKKL